MNVRKLVYICNKNNMKIIFLDIDGVLNSEKFSIWIHEHPEFCENGGHFWIDPEKVEMVINLCEETGAKIVISSSWRGWSLKTTLEDFSTYRDLSKLNPYIVGVTPKFFMMYSNTQISRGNEIQHYLNKHQSITHYCIIDDDNDMLQEQQEKFVQTDNQVGLTVEDYQKVINILK